MKGARPEREPSTRGPVLWGALATFALHAPAVLFPVLWIPVIGACGCTGLPTGLLAAWLAQRSDPRMSPAAGFSTAFVAAGLGAILASAWTALSGFELSAADLSWLREQMLAGGSSEQQVALTLGRLQDQGAAAVVATGAFVALWSGITGASVVAFRRRRSAASARKAPPPPAPPRA
ncbi:MAG: hypothetical protein Fur0037_01230 [Planctomycetota bacterium]